MKNMIPASRPRGTDPRAFRRFRLLVLIASSGLCGGAVTQGPQDWMSARVLSSRSDHAMAYDAARQRVVLFGGSAGSSGVLPFSDTWEWDGSSWVQRSVATSPAARSSHALVYDSVRQRVVLFGGFGGAYPRALFDTWEWDGSNWTQRAPFSSPSARQGHAMAYDNLRQRVVLFGGMDQNGGLLSDTWEWDGSNWIQRLPTPSPPASAVHAMAYDAARQRVVLWSGGNLTWEWDGSNWTSRSSSTSPSSAADRSMAYEPARQRVVLVESDSSRTNTWEWDGGNWIPRSSTSNPGGRQGIAIANDLARQRIVLCGGRTWKNGPAPLSDTWEWDGTNWTQRSPSTSPDERYAAAMAYDVARHRGVLFGGGRGPSNSYLADTWEWDGGRWTQRLPTTSPSARLEHAMVYDVLRQRVVLFGGCCSSYLVYFGDTWEWDGSSWTQRSPATSPSPRQGHAMAYDIARQRVVLFGGGNYLNDTWEWDGSVWTPRSPTTRPGARQGHAMAYDLARQRTVLFGGRDANGLLADTWEWDGNSWTQRTPSTRPSERQHHAMVYDIARQRVVLFGGGSGSIFFSDTWEWDGNDWTLQAPTTSPGARINHAMAYDADHRRIVMVRGGTWLFGDHTPATAQSIGRACSGTNGPPILASNEPYLGSPALRLQLLSARASSAYFFALAAAPDNLALGGGCTLYLKSPFVPWVGMTDGSGFAESPPVLIPFDMALLGAKIYAQAVVADPQGRLLGFAFSAGRELVLGD